MVESISISLYIVGMFIIGCKLPISNIETKRKIAHIAASLWWVFAALLITYSDYLLLVPAISFILIYVVSKFCNNCSLDRNDNIKEYGVLFFFVGILGLLLIIKSTNIQFKLGAIFAIPLIFGDSAAALFGKKFGKKHFFGWIKSKSIVGSLAMFMSSTLFLLLYNLFFGLNFSLWNLILISLLATFFELISIKGIDNFTIPCATALIYTLF